MLHPYTAHVRCLSLTELYSSHSDACRCAAYTANLYPSQPFSFFFFFNDTATTEIYTLSLHDALPIYDGLEAQLTKRQAGPDTAIVELDALAGLRSEEHTSELQSQSNLVCRLLLEKKKKKYVREPNYHDGVHSSLPHASSVHCTCTMPLTNGTLLEPLRRLSMRRIYCKLVSLTTFFFFFFF